MEQFKKLEQSHVEAIIADSPVVHMSREVSEGTAEPAPPEVLYRRGRTSTICTFVLTGKVVVRAGKDGESEFRVMRERGRGVGGERGGALSVNLVHSNPSVVVSVRHESALKVAAPPIVISNVACSWVVRYAVFLRRYFYRAAFRSCRPQFQLQLLTDVWALGRGSDKFRS